MTRSEFVANTRAMADSIEARLPPKPTEPGLIPIQYGLIEWMRDFANRVSEAGNGS